MRRFLWLNLFLAALSAASAQTGTVKTAHDLALPKQCADSSGSGTAQSCSTAPTFTPAANDLIIYTTTTANTGTSLTVNVTSLGAKSVAIAGSSGWTTTLTAGVIQANKPVLMIYDGANWDVMQTGTAASGGGGSSGTLVQSSTTTSSIAPASLISSVASTPGMYTDQWDVSITTVATGTCTGSSLLNLYLMWINPSVPTTTLSAAVTTTGQTSISVTSGVDVQNNQYILLGSEYALVVSGGGTSSLTVTRAQLGTTASTYSNGATVTVPNVELAATLSLGNTNSLNGYRGSVANGIESILAKNATAIQYATTYTAGAGCTAPPTY